MSSKTNEYMYGKLKPLKPASFDGKTRPTDAVAVYYSREALREYANDHPVQWNRLRMAAGQPIETRSSTMYRKK